MLESVRTWARGLFLLAVFSSTVMLLVPKRVQRQARFVSELLLLLCVIAPVAGLLKSGTTGLSLDSAPATFTDLSLGRFYSVETAQRIAELGTRCGVETQAVSVTTKDGGLSLDRVEITLKPGIEDDRIEAFREAIQVYTGIPGDKVEIVMGSPS